MKKFCVIALAWLAFGIASANAETPVDLQALLIRASNEPAALNYKLDEVVPKLRQVFKFQNYDLIGEGSATITPPGQTTIDLGRGHSLEISIRHERGRMRAEARWLHKGKVLLNTGAALGAQPFIMAGPKEGDGTLIVTVTAK